MGVQVGLRSRDGKFRDCAAGAPSCESSRGEPDTDLVVGARSSDDLLLGERGRRVVLRHIAVAVLMNFVPSVPT